MDLSVSREDARVVVDRCARDPAWFARHVLGVSTLWSKQREIMESVRDHPRTAVRSCHGAGKTFIAACTVWWFLLVHPDSVVITTAPTNRQVEQLLWREIRGLYFRALRAGIKLSPEPLNKQINITPNHYALGFSTDDPDAAQGFHGRRVLVVVDEAAGYDRSVFDALEGALSGEGSRLLTIGNPTDPGSVLGTESKSAGTRKIQIGAADTPNVTAGRVIVPGLVTREWVEDKVRRWGDGSPLYQAKVLGEFPAQASDSLVPLAWVTRAQLRELAPGEPVELGVDVARFGDDETVAYLRRGQHARLVHHEHGASTMETAGKVVSLLRETRATAAKIDGVGIGAGVVDRVKELSLPAQDLQAGGAASDRERFTNARAEWFWGLRERFELGEIDIDEQDDELAQQLTTIRYKQTSSGKIQIERKDEMKDRGLPSPDRADGLMLAFASTRTQDASLVGFS
jgi:hypothetical protein